MVATPIYPKRVALPSPGQNEAGADRPRPFSATQVCLGLPVLRRQSLGVEHSCVASRVEGRTTRFFVVFLNFIRLFGYPAASVKLTHCSVFTVQRRAAIKIRRGRQNRDMWHQASYNYCGRQNCSPPGAPTTHATPLVAQSFDYGGTYNRTDWIE